MRAIIAERTVELIGCDTMPNADKFALFEHDFHTADCTIRVTVHDKLEKPCGQDFQRIGDWIRVRTDDRRIVCGHKNGTAVYEADEDYRDVHVRLHRQLSSLDAYHYLHVSRMFQNHLQRNGGCLIHSSGIKIENSGLALCGRSGAGKTTMTRLLQQEVPRMRVLCDDSPAIRTDGESPVLYGTPFCGQDECCANDRAPLKGLVFLKQAPHDRVVELSPPEAMYQLLTVMQRSALDDTMMQAMTDRLVTIIQHVPIVCFENRGTADSAKYILDYASKHGIL